jgi:hypothetical protein
MRILPETYSAQIDFLAALLPGWAADPGAVGLSPQAVAELQGLLDAARELRTGAAAARAAAQSATMDYHLRAEELRRRAALAIAAIKLAAAADPNVYTAAKIPAPAAPSPAKAPAAPRNVRAVVEATGACVLSWSPGDTRGNTGIYYTIERKAPGQRRFHLLGSADSRTFRDERLAAGTSLYRVRAHRRRLTSPYSPMVEISVGVALKAGPRTVAAAMEMDEDRPVEPAIAA